MMLFWPVIFGISSLMIVRCHVIEQIAPVLEQEQMPVTNDQVIDVNPIRDGRNLALLVVSITRTYRVTSVTTTPVTSIAKCYRPTTIAICSKRKRDILVISGPEGAEEEMDAYFKQLQLQPGEAMEVVPVDLADEPVELSSSVDLVGEVSSSVYDTHGFDLDLANVRHRRLFRPQSFVSSTTLTTTSTFTSTFWGSTIETIAYVNCRAPRDPIAPACSGP